MKVVAIGDVHGRDAWKQVDVTAADQLIFLGDYTDSRQGFTDEVIYQNLTEIIQLKQREPGKIVLLLGNHDVQYLHFPAYQCSGFRPSAQPALTGLFRQYASLFQIACQHDTHLFTHAGLSNGWYQSRKSHLEPVDSPNSLADQLNALHKQDDESYPLFDVGRARGGYDAHGGPLWADRSETSTDYLSGYHQVAGHTPVSAITTVGDAQQSITYCDVTQTKAEFYEVML